MTTTLLKPSISQHALGPMSTRVTVEPLERGFGHTLGNALRRVMMSSIPGFAATKVKITGVMHECDRLDGMREEVIWLLLNIKNIIFKMNDSDSEVVRLSKKGACQVVAGDLQLTQNIEILNPDCALATLTKGGELEIEITVESGVGYRAATDKNVAKEIGVIDLDASFCPVKRMNFTVGSTRHENRVDLDRLIMEIESNGVFSCEELVRHSSQILIDQFSMLANTDNMEIHSSMEKIGRHHDSAANPIYSEKVDILELAVRAKNCLRSENIRYIGELVQRDEKKMMEETSNMGKKSLAEIQLALDKHDLKLGTILPNWKAPR